LSWLSGQATELCVNLQFKDQDNNSITKYINFDYSDDDNVTDFSGGYGYAYNGEAKVSILAKSGNDTTMKVSFYNPFTYVYQTVDNISLSESCDNYTIHIDNPLQCKVQGTVTDNSTGDPVDYQYIYAYNASNYGYYGYGYTDSNGEYSIDVPCDTSIKLYYYSNDYQVKSARVDNNTNDNETSDDGAIAIVNFSKENQKPQGYGYLSTYSHQVNTSHTVYFYAYDYEDNYPINYTLKENDTEVDTGSFSSTDWNYKTYTHTPTNSDNYKYTLELTDSAGKKSTISLGTVKVLPAGNRPPVIATVFTSPTSTKVGKNLFFYYSIYDPEDDPMKIEFVADNDSCIIDNTSQPAYYVTSNEPVICKITMIVSDNNSNADNATITVTFTPNNPPVIYPYQYDSSVRIGDTINLSAYVYDPDGDSLSYTWADNCSGGNVSVAGTTNASITSYTVESCQVTLTASDGSDTRSYVYNVTFTDNKAPVVTIDVSNSTPKPGETITLTCNAVDPDGDNIKSYLWTYDNTTADTYNISYTIPNNTPDNTDITFTCEATDDFTSSPKTGSKSVDIKVTTNPTYGDITITSVK